MCNRFRFSFPLLFGRSLAFKCFVVDPNIAMHLWWDAMHSKHLSDWDTLAIISSSIHVYVAPCFPQFWSNVFFKRHFTLTVWILLFSVRALSLSLHLVVLCYIWIPSWCRSRCMNIERSKKRKKNMNCRYKMKYAYFIAFNWFAQFSH